MSVNVLVLVDKREGGSMRPIFFSRVQIALQEISQLLDRKDPISSEAVFVGSGFRVFRDRRRRRRRKEQKRDRLMTFGLMIFHESLDDSVKQNNF